MKRVRRLTANCTVRISAEADQLRAELQEATGLPANKLFERCLLAFKADLDRNNGGQVADACRILRERSGREGAP
jgi:hypothetical protein